MAPPTVSTLTRFARWGEGRNRRRGGAHASLNKQHDQEQVGDGVTEGAAGDGPALSAARGVRPRAERRADAGLTDPTAATSCSPLSAAVSKGPTATRTASSRRSGAFRPVVVGLSQLIEVETGSAYRPPATLTEPPC
jgi:hypothetical protein